MITRQIANQLELFVGEPSRNKPAHQLDTFRGYGVGAKIRAALVVGKLVLLSDSPRATAALLGLGLDIVGHRRAREFDQTIDRSAMTAAHDLERVQ